MEGNNSLLDIVEYGPLVSLDMILMINGLLMANPTYLSNRENVSMYWVNGSRIYVGDKILLHDLVIVPEYFSIKKTSPFIPLIRLSQFESKLVEALSEVKISDDSSVLEVDGTKQLKHPSKLIYKYPRDKFLESLVQVSMRDTGSAGNEEPEEQKTSSMSYDQLIRSYHESLLEKTNGNAAAASRIADVPYQTFKTRLRRLKIKFDVSE